MDFGILKALLEIGKSSIGSIQGITKNRRQRKALLDSFGSDFSTHDDYDTRFVDYFRWFEDDLDWKTGNGVLQSATYGELLKLWANPRLFVLYEARLRQFLRNGGKTHRVFLLGSDIGSLQTKWLLMQAIRRHQELGFDTKVHTVVSFWDSMKACGISCDTSGVLNNRISYFLKFPDTSDPLMLRCIRRTVVLKTGNFLLDLWKNARPADEWLRAQACELPEQLKSEIKLQIEAIETIAGS